MSDVDMRYHKKLVITDDLESDMDNAPTLLNENRRRSNSSTAESDINLPPDNVIDDMVEILVIGLFHFLLSLLPDYAILISRPIFM